MSKTPEAAKSGDGNGLDDGVVETNGVRVRGVAAPTLATPNGHVNNNDKNDSGFLQVTPCQAVLSPTSVNSLQVATRTITPTTPTLMRAFRSRWH